MHMSQVEGSRYLDPLAICEAKHHGPNTWKNDHDLFKNCKTPAQIAKERKFHLKEAMKMAAYIAKMMKKQEDDADVIFAPYNIRYFYF